MLPYQPIPVTNFMISHKSEGSHLARNTAIAPHLTDPEWVEGWVNLGLVDATGDWIHTIWVVNAER